MNRFSRIRHHVDMKDVKQRHLEENVAKKIKEKQIEEEKRIQKEIYDAWKSDWRQELNEKMTSAGTFQFLVKGEEGNQFTTGLGFTEDGVNQLSSEFFSMMNTVDDPTNVGKKLGGGPIGAGYQNAYGGIGQYDSSTREAQGIESTPWQQRAVTGSMPDGNDNPRFVDIHDFPPGTFPTDRKSTSAENDAAKAATKVLGKNDCFRACYPINVQIANGHLLPSPPLQPEELVGLNAFDTIDGVNAYERCGQGIMFGGAFDPRTPRFFTPNGVDARRIDAIEITGAVAGLTAAGSGIQVFYWAGDKPGFQSLQNVNAHPISDYPQTKRQFDGWRPIAQKPNGETDPSVNSVIMDGNNLPPGVEQRKIGKFVLPIPEWCRSANTRFLYIQMSSSGSARIYKIGYQRRNNAVIAAPLDDPESSSFVRVGPGMDKMGAKERAKKVNDMLKASREYMLRSLGYASLFNDEVKISDVVDSSFDFQSVMQGSGAYGNTRFNELISQEKRQAASKKAQQARKTTNQRKSSNRFRGYKRTGRGPKGMTTSAKVNPKDIYGSI